MLQQQAHEQQANEKEEGVPQPTKTGNDGVEDGGSAEAQVCIHTCVYIYIYIYIKKEGVPQLTKTGNSGLEDGNAAEEHVCMCVCVFICMYVVLLARENLWLRLVYVHFYVCLYVWNMTFENVRLWSGACGTCICMYTFVRGREEIPGDEDAYIHTCICTQAG